MRKRILFYFLSIMFIFSTVASAKKIDITGSIAVIGHEPFIELVLSDKNHQQYLLEKNELWQELFKLQGATIRVSGIASANDPIYNSPILNVSNYEILWIGEGETRQKPWVGTIKIKDNLVYLQTSKNNCYQIVGPNEGTFKNYLNSKVWVTGTQQKQLLRRTNKIYVTAYCIIKETAN